MIASLLEGTLVLVLALATGQLCPDPQRRTALWFVALMVQPLILLTSAVGLGWQPWVVTQTVTPQFGAPTPSSSSAFAFVACVYGAGWLLRALPWLRSLAWAHRIVASAAIPRPPHWRHLNAMLAQSSRRSVPLLRVHAAVDAPFLTGALRPAICIPTSLEFCDRTHARHVLLHEHAHWRANDWWRAQGVEFVVCLLWFHPLVHSVRARFRRDLELACDARVLEAGADAREYAHTLLQLSRADAGSGTMALGMATKRSLLVDRIACIVTRRPVAGFARRWPFAMLGAAGLAACAINPLPRVVYELIQPPPLSVEATSPIPTRGPPPPASMTVATPPGTSVFTAAVFEAAAPRSVESGATTSPARPSAASTETTEARRIAIAEPHATTPASSVLLYKSLAQVALEDVPWPATDREAQPRIATQIDTQFNQRFEEGMRKGRIEREQRIERNWGRAWMITGRIPL